jgi:prepilin-type N-terminal cleavage/methylation domain-containing protein
MRIPRSEKGFTLVEIMVSLAIFGILMVAFLSIFSTALGLTLRAGHNDQTVAAVSGDIEKSMADDTYTAPDITLNPGQTATITYADGSTNTVTVDETVGTDTTADGEQVTIKSYETAASP